GAGHLVADPVELGGLGAAAEQEIGWVGHAAELLYYCVPTRSANCPKAGCSGGSVGYRGYRAQSRHPSSRCSFGSTRSGPLMRMALTRLSARARASWAIYSSYGTVHQWPWSSVAALRGR